MHTRTIYQCEFCKKEFTEEAEALAHEKKHNPVRVSEYEPKESREFDKPVPCEEPEILTGYPQELWVTFPDHKVVRYHSDEQFHHHMDILIKTLERMDARLKLAEAGLQEEKK